MPSGKCACGAATLLGLWLVCALLVLEAAEARPPATYSNRSKRFSEQKILDIEAKLAYSKLKGKPVVSGYNNIDEGRVGRIRRSSMESHLKELRRILRSIVYEDSDYEAKGRRRVYDTDYTRWKKNRALRVVDFNSPFY